MNYYKRLYEFVSLRYDQEQTRQERAGTLRLFYFGLLGGGTSAIISMIERHGITYKSNRFDFCFWIAVTLATAWGAFAFCQLILAIRPKKVGFFPTPHEMLRYAEGCFEHYHALNPTDANDRVEEDLDRVLAKSVAVATTHNFEVNNVRADHTVRAFWGLLVMGFLLLLAYLFFMFAPAESPIYNVRLIEGASNAGATKQAIAETHPGTTTQRAEAPNTR